MSQTAARIVAVVFDSGGVLLKHRHAFLEPETVSRALDRIGLGPVDEERLARAVAEAVEWLGRQPALAMTEREAAAQRIEYYTRLLTGLQASAPLRQAMRLRDCLECPASVEPFPEVREVLDRLTALGLKLGVLSDGWPSTIRLYEQVGLAHYFRSWTFSAVVGCCKPDPRMFAAAAGDLGIEPARLLFVDDLPANVEGALRCGWQAAWLNRDGARPPRDDLETLGDLRELPALASK